jgi:hypothetical protein
MLFFLCAVLSASISIGIKTEKTKRVILIFSCIASCAITGVTVAIAYVLDHLGNGELFGTLSGTLVVFFYNARMTGTERIWQVALIDVPISICGAVMLYNIFGRPQKFLVMQILSIATAAIQLAIFEFIYVAFNISDWGMN